MQKKNKNNFTFAARRGSPEERQQGQQELHAFYVAHFCFRSSWETAYYILLFREGNLSLTMY